MTRKESVIFIVKSKLSHGDIIASDGHTDIMCFKCEKKQKHSKTRTHSQKQLKAEEKAILVRYPGCTSPIGDFPAEREARKHTICVFCVVFPIEKRNGRQN